MTYPEQIVQLDPDKPNVAIITLQASNPDGAPLTSAQVDAARNAAVSVLQLLGAEVADNSSVFATQPDASTLRVNVKTE